MTRTDHARGGRRFAVEQALAPHVEPQWAQDVLLELRVLGVDGTDIARVLSDVEVHVVATGVAAATAFGDPVAYARSLALPVEPDDGQDARGVDVLQSAAQIVGVIVLFGGASALGRGEDAAVTWGMLCSALLATGATALLLRHGERVLRAVVRSRARRFLVTVLAIAMVVAVLLAVLPTLLLTAEAFTLRAEVALVVGAVLFLGATTLGIVRGARIPDDPISLAERGTPQRRWVWLSSVPLVVAVVLGVVAMYFLGRAS
ncbi:hypothetical protein [Cellulomonas palmilytica]|uniref:hypothetical protein n=1 Tax=Cellulomonas palmilytica TaxID=2608402 RepID=UPI001F27A136|nr:hypothetical protein [Cellulomonas palmilytica]UJP40542.1 hypothetical protein F1D97_03240 [Cellulomonas palmilytica]